MATIRQQRCISCMEELRGKLVCPACGFDNETALPNEDSALPLGTLLADGRYLLGMVKNSNGGGITYIGFDYEEKINVLITEYMPKTLAKRLDGEDELIPLDRADTQYKTFKVDFSDIYMALMNMKNKDGIFPVIDCFEQNNTVYAVAQFFDSIPLCELLGASESLTADQVLAIFDPILHTLSYLHRNNIVHRGLSPLTIYIDKNGDLHLTGFAISSVRTVDSELETEIFPGYTAPEQYSVTGLQGTWTDVYSISAVMYRALSGVEPTPADERGLRQLKPLDFFVKNLPSSILYAIDKGLTYAPEERIQNMDVFIEYLRYGPDSGEDGAQTRLVDVRGTAQSGSTKGKKMAKKSTEKSRIPLIAISIGATVIVAAVLLFTIFRGVGNVLPEVSDSSSEASTDMSGIESSSSSEDLTAFKVPKLVGKYIEAAKTDKYYALAFNLEPEYVPDELAPKDTIVEQSIEPGTIINAASGPVNIKVKISSGPAEIDDVTGLTLEAAEVILKEAKIEYTVATQYSSRVDEGIVVKLQRTGGKVLLVVSKGPHPGGSSDNGGGSSSSSSDDNYWSSWGGGGS